MRTICSFLHGMSLVLVSMFLDFLDIIKIKSLNVKKNKQREKEIKSKNNNNNNNNNKLIHKHRNSNSNSKKISKNMQFKFALFLAAVQTASAMEFGLSGPGNNNAGGNGNGQGQGQGTGASTGTTTNQGQIPLSKNFIRSYEGTEDPRSGNDAELLRLVGPANYPDGKGIDLSMITEPNARRISNLVNDPLTLSTPPGKSIVSDMFWQWGQFMDHDIGLTEGHDEAFTIVSPDCMDGDVICQIPFQRAIHHFTNGIREQINEITGFLDASNVYGHTEERANALREFTGGRMKMTPEGLLPPNTPGLANANPGFDASDFFLGGDVRVNEQSGLIAIHTLFVREHNRLVALLAGEFPSATDEELFQMARKIVQAELQAVTYKEFLPVMIGSFAPDLSNYNGYQSNVNPGIATEFSTVAFRVGHTFLSGMLLLHDGSERTGAIQLLNAFFDPTMFHTAAAEGRDLIAEVLIGQTRQAANAADTKVIPEVRDFLFGHPVGGIGLDLVSLNIQRGRDNGVQLYNNMRVGLGLSRKTSFSQITSNSEIADELASAYTSPDECDPWICGLAEDPVGGGQLGELFATIIGDQFQRLMDGDQFFYLNDNDLDHPKITAIIDVDTITLADIINANVAQPSGGSTAVVHPAMLA